MKLIRKTLDAWKLYRFGIFRMISNRLFPKVFAWQTLILYRLDLKKNGVFNRQENRSFIIKKINSDQDKLFREFHKKFPAQEFANRIKNEKEAAYIALKDGEIAAYAWVTEKKLFLDAVNCTYILNNDEIFLHSCFVCKENRGKGLHLALLYERLRDYSQKDQYRWAYAGVLSFNRGSIKGVKKAGFKEIGKIRYLKLLNKEKRWGLNQNKHQNREKLPYLN